MDESIALGYAKRMTRILITGFGPFPGAPSNPTMRLARHLGQIRRPRYGGVTRLVRLLPTTWAMLDTIPALLQEIRPDVVLMLGLAGRRRQVTPELRAVNHQSALKPDADGAFCGHRSRVRNAPLALRSPIHPRYLQAAIQRLHVPVKVSQDAGNYLCNALSWAMLASGVPAIFVHVPRPRRMTRPRGSERRFRPTMRQLMLAAEVALDQVLRQAGHHAVGR